MSCSSFGRCFGDSSPRASATGSTDGCHFYLFSLLNLLAALRNAFVILVVALDDPPPLGLSFENAWLWRRDLYLLYRSCARS